MYTDIELMEMAVLAIYNYYDGEYTKDYIKEHFKLALKVLIENTKSMGKISGVSSISENGTSITYKEGYEKFSMTSDVLALLPKKTNFRVW
ncbi:hypothetical protein HF846_15750 [Clostridium cadaveris]|uniref:Phage gp6-like head-tail connector protein n=1 Tax=Clostridium cadaveris TaxID=1529 RepID=A0A316MB59_9CLOT|nr:hypothetical protein [Clostridium cadaveris]NME66042.1 hypothetical protein [Clostridium cadaveris]PWL53753.1 MAG: hypothetical protein DBY38_06665 [Clostridium cadaveris]